MGWWLGCPVQIPDRYSRRHKNVGVIPFRVYPRVPIQVFGDEIAG